MRQCSLRPRNPNERSEALKATRNYAVEHIRNGICPFIEVSYDARAEALACRAARLLTATLLKGGSHNWCSRWWCRGRGSLFGGNVFRHG